MPLLLIGIGLWVLVLVFAWALCRIAGLSDEALDAEHPSWCDNPSVHHHVTRHYPPKGW